MSKKQPTDKQKPKAKSVPRREALKGIGAFAISAPSLAAIACSSDPNPTTGVMNTPVIGGSGAAPSTGVAGSVSAAAGATSTTTGTGAGAAATGTSNVAGTNATSGTAGKASPTSAGTGSAGKSAGGSSGSTSAAGNGASGTGAGGNAAVGGNSGASGSSSTGSGDFLPVDFDTVASCTLTPTDPAGEGPFFLHEDEVMNDESLKRSDMRGGKPGVELQLNLRVLDSDGKCMTPISGVEVYVWHTDALGMYSGFNNQNPDMSYSGAFERTVENNDRFCRGIQITDKDGIVRFRTVYPGWYNGRAIHIHFVALRPGSTADTTGTTSYRNAKYMVFTTQMYFAEQFSRMIHEHNTPYMTRASGAAYNMYVKPQNMTVNPTAKMQGTVAIGALNVITSGMGSRR